MRATVRERFQQNLSKSQRSQRTHHTVRTIPRVAFNEQNGGDADDTQQPSPSVTPIKSEQIFDMYFDTIFYWYWRGVHNIKYSSAFQEIRAGAVLSQKLSRDPWGVPIRSNRSEPRSAVVQFLQEIVIYGLYTLYLSAGFCFVHTSTTAVIR